MAKFKVLVIMIVVVWRRSRHSQFLLTEVHDFWLLLTRLQW
jgi:hypothetical protein